MPQKLWLTGHSTFWLDEAEPEFTTYDFENYRYFAGPVAEVGNIYPREYARLFYEGQKSEGQEDIVNLIRCAWAESQRYGALVWSGDILVAPICHENAYSRTVYLPKGAKWLHAGTGIWYEGGRTIVADAPLERMPLFLREGRQAYLDEMLR